MILVVVCEIKIGIIIIYHFIKYVLNNLIVRKEATR